MTAAQQNPARFLRSVRLETDAGSGGALAGYVVTPQVRAVLRRILQALGPDGTERAMTLTGPYGTGKSAFALFLVNLLQDPQNPAWALLEQADAPLARLARDTLPRPMLPVALTLRRARLSALLLEGMHGAAGRLQDAALQGRFEVLSQGEGADSRRVLETLDALQSSARAAGFGGLVLVFDEMGKGLEHEARYGSDDIYLLQELAEVAGRSGDTPLLFVGVLHQGFEQYGEGLLAAARQEWGKVQGRFADVAFLEPPEQQMRLATQATGALRPLPPTTLRQKMQAAARTLAALPQSPLQLSLGASEFAALARQAAPLHPLTLLALPLLFRRFAQNERSLFAYLLSGEPQAVPQRWAQRQQAVRLPELFDYFVANLLPGLSRHGHARRWLEVLDALERAPDLNELEANTLKTVGLLNILSDVGGVPARAEVISIALHDTPGSPAVLTALERLQERSLIVARHFDRSYRVWEGSDLDIEARLEEGRRLAGSRLELSEILERHLQHHPLVARRHSEETGTLRYFEVQYADTPPASPEAIRSGRGGDGVLLCALPAGAEQAQQFEQWARGPVAERADVVLAVPQALGALREAALEVWALHWLRDNTPALRDDRVARREVAERLTLLDAALASGVEQLLDPRAAPVGSGTVYWHQGEPGALPTPRAVARMFSDVLDGLYANSPRVQNELINRRVPSSAAAKGRRVLIERMFTPELRHLPRLGIEPGAFPPERSMYESILRGGGLHVPGSADDGIPEDSADWAFAEPAAGHPTNLAPSWEAMKAAVFGASEPLNVQALFEQLAAPPYGVTAGLFPILLSAFLQLHAHELSVYREGVFIPEPGIADMEVLVRRPELFSVRGVHVRGARAAVIERFARGYRTPVALVPVVRALFAGVRTLPDTAHRTRRLPPEVLRLRDTFTQGRSPEQLLFTDVPGALGLPPIGDDTIPEQVEAFFAALNRANATWRDHAPRQTARARDQLLHAFGFPQDDVGWRALLQQARALQDRPLPASLKPLVQRMAAEGEDDAVLDGVLALVAGRSPRSWYDADAEQFPLQARTVAQTYRFAAAQLGHVSPAVEQGRQRFARTLRGALKLDGTAQTPTERDALRLALIGLVLELDDAPPTEATARNRSH